ncbi:MAG: hypothetical protein ACT4PT_11205 [Methanobacteriota archaeon]
MKPVVNDIRLLKLAELYERAYEEFVLGIATDIVEDADVRARLLRLTSPQDRHGERIVAHLTSLNARVTEADRPAVLRAALLDVCDVERAARDFYLSHVDSVHEPAVARLFRELAAEEARHLRIAEETLALVDRRAGRIPQREDEGSETTRLFRDSVSPLWEGTSDYGGRKETRPARKGA